MGKLAVGAISALIILIYGTILYVPHFDYSRMTKAFFIVALVGVALLLVARYAVSITKTVNLKGVTPSWAIRSAGQAIWAAEDHMVGWPSGTFEVQPGDQPNQFVGEEWLPKGGSQLLKSFVQVPWNIAIMITGFSAIFGWVGLLIGFILAATAYISFLFFFVVPLLLAFLVEAIFKKWVASRIEVKAVQIQDGSQLTLTFRGASALLVMNKVLGAFEPPKLPARFAGLVAQPAPTNTGQSAL
ncbi:hypothetical protein V5R04_14705 [Jonesiaceae bacterium BS-20]|uniref:Uncharacterized protein n=1 Tax=Jonesiaceae bacterium BS-20 TaxID=3120821 RepID=A0AAU7DTE0_9MICO